MNRPIRVLLVFSLAFCAYAIKRNLPGGGESRILFPESLTDLLVLGVCVALLHIPIVYTFSLRREGQTVPLPEFFLESFLMGGPIGSLIAWEFWHYEAT